MIQPRLIYHVLGVYFGCWKSFVETELANLQCHLREPSPGHAAGAWLYAKRYLRVTPSQDEWCWMVLVLSA